MLIAPVGEPEEAEPEKAVPEEAEPEEAVRSAKSLQSRVYHSVKLKRDTGRTFCRKQLCLLSLIALTVILCFDRKSRNCPRNCHCCLSHFFSFQLRGRIESRDIALSLRAQLSSMQKTELLAEFHTPHIISIISK